MPSRFTGLAPQSLVRPNQIVMDVYDDVPYDPNYQPLTTSTTRRAL